MRLSSDEGANMFCGSKMTAAPLTWITKDEIQGSRTENKQNDEDPWKMTALCSESLRFGCRCGAADIGSISGTNLVRRLI